MTNKEKIIAEIEKVKVIIQSNRAQGAFAEGYLIGQESVLEHFENFVNSMQKEPESHKPKITSGEATGKLKELLDNMKDSAAKDLGLSEEDYNKVIDECLYGKEPELVDDGDLPKEEPVSEDLEDFAKREADLFAEREYECDSYDKGYLSKGFYWGCKVGANWQKEQDKQWLAEEHKHIFAKGRDSMKQQMMKNAKEGVITFDYYGDNDKIYGCIAHDSFSLEELGLKDGDKVKLIIIKEE